MLCRLLRFATLSIVMLPIATSNESGSQSLNLLLRGLQTGVISPQAMRQLGRPQIDWTPAIAAPVETQPVSLPLPLVPAEEYLGVYEEMPLAA